MKKTVPRTIDQALLFTAEGAIIALLAGFVFLFLYCLFYRTTYPFELEWLEGSFCAMQCDF